MPDHEVLYILLAALMSMLGTGLAAYIIWGRRIMTKEDHEVICKLREKNFSEKISSLLGIAQRNSQTIEKLEKKLEKQDEKLDTILLEVRTSVNGGKQKGG